MVDRELIFTMNREKEKEHLAALADFKSPVPDEIYPRIPKELLDVTVEPLSVIFFLSLTIGTFYFDTTYISQ